MICKQKRREHLVGDTARLKKLDHNTLKATIYPKATLKRPHLLDKVCIPPLKDRKLALCRFVDFVQ